MIYNQYFLLLEFNYNNQVHIIEIFYDKNSRSKGNSKK